MSETAHGCGGGVVDEQQRIFGRRRQISGDTSLVRSLMMNEPVSAPKSVVVFLLGLISLIWLLNPPIIGTLDDNIPLIGNLDEAAAALILINCLKYFGFDLTRIFQAGKRGVDGAEGQPKVVEVDSEVLPTDGR